MKRRNKNKKKCKSTIKELLIIVIIVMTILFRTYCNDNILQPYGDIKQVDPGDKESDKIEHIRLVDELIDKMKRKGAIAIAKIDNDDRIGGNNSSRNIKIEIVNEIEIGNNKRTLEVWRVNKPWKTNEDGSGLLFKKEKEAKGKPSSNRNIQHISISFLFCL